MRIYKKIISQIKLFEKNYSVYNHIYISKSAILHNYDLLSKLSPGGLVIPVLKSNAYGHGLKQIATILKQRKTPYIAVDGYYEGLRIREVSSQKVLVMGSIRPENFSKINPKSFAFAVSDMDTIKAMGQTMNKFFVHIEIETGMGRHGVRADMLSKFLDKIKQYDNLIIEGVMTHLADADNPIDRSHIDLQTKRFDDAVETIQKSGFNPKYIHIAQSAGSTKIKSKYANTIRTGLALYGINPLEDCDEFANKLSSLRPALTLTSTIAKVSKIDVGESVSYNRKFIAKRDSTIGVIPIGYYEGLPRALSCVGKIKHHQKYLPIVGRVCMNHTMIDMTESDAKLGDQITIISNDPKDQLSLINICKDHKLFSYGLLTSLNENIRRTIID